MGGHPWSGVGQPLLELWKADYENENRLKHKKKVMTKNLCEKKLL
jgi:hypothetical protein